MKIVIKKSKLVFFGLFIVNLIIGFLAFFVLPERYFYDTKIIILDRHNEIGLLGSYPFTILFYKITALKYLPYPILALIQLPILIYILYKIGIPSNFHKINIKNILVYISFFMMAIFVSMPSKEFITFIYVSIVIWIYQTSLIYPKYKIILSLFFISFFGIFFRPYFLLIPILAIGMYCVTFIKFKNKTFSVIFYGILIIIFISISLGAIGGKHLSESSRDVVNTERMNSKDANSMIVSPLKTDTWYGETAGIIYGFISVNIPLEGFKHIFSVQIIAFILWQLALFYILLVRFSRCINNRFKKDYQFWTLLILFSFFIIQGAFEPDLGSAIRHKIGVFPLIYYVLYYEHFRKKV